MAAADNRRGQKWVSTKEGMKKASTEGGSEHVEEVLEVRREY